MLTKQTMTISEELNNLASELNNLASKQDVLRKKSLNASNNAAQKMVKRVLKCQPPFLYYKGDAVLVRIPISKKSVKGKKTSLQNS